MQYLNLFIIFSIIGFLFENVVSIFGTGAINSGFFNGPWTPIYGFAMIIILFVNRFLKKEHMNKTIEKFKFFFIITIVLTILELIGGYLIQFLFKKEFWSYENMPLHIGKYIAVEVSIFWGVLAVIINYYIYPMVRNLIKRIPTKVTILLYLLFVVDIGLRIYQHFK